ncbi:hypothetical protein [Saccharopolyspora hattusasensis]|uniref:hypothetical protein n=1 Tax=Saccharopolyspora hattusasensis TaxID=1128679 RepID=UPI003D97CC0E
MGAVQHDPATSRAAIRAFVRANHPDVGGDPEAFVAGLAELRDRRPRDRYDAPVVVVHRPRGIQGLVRRMRARWERRRRLPRVR